MLKKILSFFILFSLIILVSCQGNQMGKKYRTAYVAINGIMDSGNIDELDNYISENAVDHQIDPNITTKTGLAGIKDVFRYYHNIFPDMKTTIQSMAVSGDTLFGYCTTVGTASKPFMGMDAGSQMTLNAVDVVMFKEGKMNEHWGFMDMSDVMKMMQQSAMVGQEEGMMEGEMNQ